MKKILISLFAINIAVLTIVFSILPKKIKAEEPKKYKAYMAICPPYDNHNIKRNICYQGTIYVYCINGPCGVTIE